MKFERLKAMLAVYIIIVTVMLTGCSFEDIPVEENMMVEYDNSKIDDYLIALVGVEGRIEPTLLKVDSDKLTPFNPNVPYVSLLSPVYYKGDKVYVIGRGESEGYIEDGILDVLRFNAYIPEDSEYFNKLEDLTDEEAIKLFAKYVYENNKVNLNEYTVPYVKEYNLIESVKKSEQEYYDDIKRNNSSLDVNTFIDAIYEQSMSKKLTK